MVEEPDVPLTADNIWVSFAPLQPAGSAIIQKPVVFSLAELAKDNDVTADFARIANLYANYAFQNLGLQIALYKKEEAQAVIICRRWAMFDEVLSKLASNAGACNDHIPVFPWGL